MGVEKVQIEEGNGVDKPKSGQSWCFWFELGHEANVIRQKLSECNTLAGYIIQTHLTTTSREMS